MRFQFVALALLLVTLSMASATTPSQWATATNGLYLPACSSTGAKHWELDVGQTVEGQIIGYDAMKAAGYTNLRLRFDSGFWILGADCSLGA